jgi:hypothetical protein
MTPDKISSNTNNLTNSPEFATPQVSIIIVVIINHNNNNTANQRKIILQLKNIK